MWPRLQPYVVEAAALCGRGCSPMHQIAALLVHDEAAARLIGVSEHCDYPEALVAALCVVSRSAVDLRGMDGAQVDRDEGHARTSPAPASPVDRSELSIYGPCVCAREMCRARQTSADPATRMSLGAKGEVAPFVLTPPLGTDGYAGGGGAAGRQACWDDQRLDARARRGLAAARAARAAAHTGHVPSVRGGGGHGALEAATACSGGCNPTRRGRGCNPAAEAAAVRMPGARRARGRGARSGACPHARANECRRDAARHPHGGRTSLQPAPPPSPPS